MATSTVKKPPPPNPSTQGLPGDLGPAIDNAAAAYGVPPDILVGFWIRESGRTFPNPYTNSAGYGGLFGTPDMPNQGAPFPYFNERATTQQQANLSAQIFGQNLRAQGGNIANALYKYSGGSYTSLPGQVTYGTYNKSRQVSQASIASGFTYAFRLAAGLLSGGITPPGQNIGSDAAGLVKDELGIGGLGKKIGFALAIGGGGMLILLGLLIVAADLGLSALTTAQSAGRNRIRSIGAPSETEQAYRQGQLEAARREGRKSIASERPVRTRVKRSAYLEGDKPTRSKPRITNDPATADIPF